LVGGFNLIQTAGTHTVNFGGLSKNQPLDIEFTTEPQNYETGFHSWSTNSFTAGIWINTEFIATSYMVFGFEENGTGNLDYALRIFSKSLIILTIDNVQVPGPFSGTFASIIGDGNWHYFSIVKNTDFVTWYVDGEVITIRATTTPILNDHKLIIGKVSGALNGFGFGSNSRFGGFHFWNDALGDKVIKEIYRTQKEEWYTVDNIWNDAVKVNDVNLFGVWKFEDTSETDFLTELGNNNTFIASNNMAVSGGRYGAVRTFNGASDNMVLNGVGTPVDYTIAFMIRPNAVTTQTISVQTASTPAASFSNVLAIAGGTPKFVHQVDDGISKVVTGTTTVEVGKEYHVVITASNSGFMRLYVNGVEEGTGLAIGTMIANGDWILGETSGFAAGGYDGTIEEGERWDIELSSSEILELNNTGIWRQYEKPPVDWRNMISDNLDLVSLYKFEEGSGNIIDPISNNDGIANGLSTYGLDGSSVFSKKAIRLDTSSEYFDLGSRSTWPTTDVTFSMFIFIPSAGGFTFFSADNTTDLLKFKIVGTTEIRIEETSVGTIYTKTLASTIADDDWHNVVFRRRFGLWDVTVDGNLLSNPTRSVNSFSLTSTTILLGRGASAAENFAGGIFDEFIIWDDDISRNNIAQIFNQSNGNYYVDYPKSFFSFKNTILDAKRDNLRYAFKMNDLTGGTAIEDFVDIFGDNELAHTIGSGITFENSGIDGDSIKLPDAITGIRGNYPFGVGQNGEDMTVVSWVREPAYTSTPKYLLQLLLPTRTRDQYLRIGSLPSGPNAFEYIDASSTSFAATFRQALGVVANTIGDNVWHMRVYVRESGSWRVYVDTVENTLGIDNSDTRSYELSSMNIGFLFRDGVHKEGWGVDEAFFDDFYVFDTALGQTEIDELYNSGVGVFWQPPNPPVFSVSYSFIADHDWDSTIATRDYSIIPNRQFNGLVQKDYQFLASHQYLNEVDSHFFVKRDIDSTIVTENSSIILNRQFDGLEQKDSSIVLDHFYLSAVTLNFDINRNIESSIVTVDNGFIPNRQYDGLVQKDLSISVNRTYFNTVQSDFNALRNIESTITQVSSQMRVDRDFVQGVLNGLDTNRDWISPITTEDSQFLVDRSYRQARFSSMRPNRIYIQRLFSNIVPMRQWLQEMDSSLRAKRNFLYGTEIGLGKGKLFKRDVLIHGGYEIVQTNIDPHVSLGFIQDTGGSLNLPVALSDGDYILEIRPVGSFWNVRNVETLQFTITGGELEAPLPPDILNLGFGNMWYGTEIFWRWENTFNTLTPDEFGLWFSTSDPTPPITGTPDATLTATIPGDFNFIFDTHTVNPTFVAVAARTGGVNGVPSFETLTLPTPVVPDSPKGQFGITDSGHVQYEPDERGIA